MNPNIRIPTTSWVTANDVQQLVVDLAEQLSDGATAMVVKNVSLASGANSIKHNAASAPRAVSIAPKANVAWWIPTEPDSEFLYIETGGAVDADIFVWF